MRIAIIDDVDHCRKSLAHLLETYCDDVEIVGFAEGIIDGINLLKETTPDLVFLDIEMQDGEGFDLLNLFPDRQFKVIFVSAHEKYAIRAFKDSPVDYILKPVKIDDLRIAVKNVEKELNVQPTSGKQKSKLAINTGKTIEIIDPADLIRCQANRKHTICILKDRVVLSSKNLKEFETILGKNGFIRVHDSHLINLNHVINFSKIDGGFVLMSNDDEIQVSQRKRKTLLSRLDFL